MMFGLELVELVGWYDQRTESGEVKIGSLAGRSHHRLAITDLIVAIRSPVIYS